MWLDQKYIGLVSSRLERFRRVSNKTYNFRCPICGDSQKNRSKARGFLFPSDDGGYLYHCHNCNITLGLSKFIETIDNSLFKEYSFEKLSLSGTNHVKSDVELFADKMKTPSFIKATPLRQLKKVSQLAWDHPVKKYVINRDIPNTYHSKLFYAPKFKKFVNSIVPDKFQSEKNDEPRLIIPFLDEEKNLFGFQGRAFSNNSIRYITIMLNDSKPKIFGLDTCDRNKVHYILEGPIDSMFVENSIAMAGGSIDWTFVNKNSVFVYDNEPRSKETCAKIQKVVDMNHKVVIWPEFIKQKDVNDMINEKECNNINKLLNNNTSQGLEAKLLFTAWRRT